MAKQTVRVINEPDLPGADTPATEATLQGVLAAVDQLEGYLDQVEGYLDGVEGSLTTLNAKDFSTSAKQDTLNTAVGTSADAASATGSLHAKLRQIADNTDGLEGFVDGLETLLTSISGFVDGLEASLTTIAGAVSGTEMQVDVVSSALPTGAATAANQATLIGHVDQIEGYIDQLEGYVDGIETALTTLNAKDFATSAKQDTLNTAIGTAADVASSTGSVHAKLRQLADNTDGLEGFVDGIETLLTSISGFVDGLETIFGTSADAASTTGSVHAKLRSIAESVDQLEGYVDQIEGFVDGIETALGTSADASSATGSLHAKLRAAATALEIMDDWDNTASDGASVSGDVAHDSTDAGEPVKIGGRAVSGSASPTSVAANDRTNFIANQHGIPYHLGGHPNLITREYDFGTSAQTNVNLAAAAVAADERCYVTRFEATVGKSTTVGVTMRAGFGASAVPTASSSGVSGMIGSHDEAPAGGGIVAGDGSAVIAVGAAGEEPRFTCGAATSGGVTVTISYFIIDETP